MAVGDSGRLAVFDFKTGKSPFEPIPLPGVPDAVAFRPDAALIAVYCQGGHVLLVDAAQGRETLRLRCDEAARARDLGPAYHPVHPRRDLPGEPRRRREGAGLGPGPGARPLPQPEEDSIGDIALSHDGRFLATGMFAYDSDALALRVWDLRTGRPVSPRDDPPRRDPQVRFSPDDRSDRDGQPRRTGAGLGLASGPARLPVHGQ